MEGDLVFNLNVLGWGIFFVRGGPKLMVTAGGVLLVCHKAFMALSAQSVPLTRVSRGIATSTGQVLVEI